MSTDSFDRKHEANQAMLKRWHEEDHIYEKDPDCSYCIEEADED